MPMIIPSRSFLPSIINIIIIIISIITLIGEYS